MVKPDDLNILKTVSLTSALERQLEDLILSGKLPPGARLNEIQLAERFGTSRGPVREATRSLEAKGLVEVIRNRGVFVRQLNLDEAGEIYDLRATLFAMAGRLVAPRMTGKLAAHLEALVQKMEGAARDNDLAAYYPLNLEFHEAILKASGNKTLIREYTRFVNKMHLFRVKSLFEDGALVISNSEHRAIVEALEAGEPDHAHLTLLRHVENAKQRMLAAVENSRKEEA
ncbi:GntR family transcriptional regulator [Rhodobacteraceae bacterium WD3A24]|nr:GntR family transcriptional regulator [Rhodobacteraceae bacterium WD3A24]